MWRSYLKALLAIAAGGLILVGSGPALAQGSSGATLQASKTLDICDNGNGTWQYSGEVSVWNLGVNEADGLLINDCLQYKTATQPGSPQNVACQYLTLSQTFIPGTTLEINAITFPYTFAGVYTTPLDPSGTIRNSAQLSITNHSGSQVNGPNPKTTWSGGTPPLCVSVGPPPSCGCELTYGYWTNHNNNVCDGTDTSGGQCVNWPGGHLPNDLFFNSGLTWLQILNTNPSGGNAYIQLAHQYIAAVLNLANGACDTNSVDQLISKSTAFFAAYTTDGDGAADQAYDCPASGKNAPAACGLANTWAASLADYNQATGGYSPSNGFCSL